MPKRQPKPHSVTPHQQPPDLTTALRKSLGTRKKAELVEILMELAEADPGLFRRLAARFAVAAVDSELVATTRRAIEDATRFDVRDMNRNFAYDYAAYGEVKRNLGRLIALGRLREAMTLSLELMKRGSYQVEMSDEGLMTQDIEDCLSEILEVLRNRDLPAAEMISWCSAMLTCDRDGVIARERIEDLLKHIQTSAKR